MERAGRAGRTAALRAGALCLLGALLTGCGVVGAAKAPAQAIEVTPRDGVSGVGAHDRLRVSVPEGRLERVRVARTGGAAGRPLPGRVSSDGHTWEPTGTSRKLKLSSEYTVHVVARDRRGRRVARHTTFATKVPDRHFIGFFTPEHRQTVGTAMILSIKFSRPIARRAAVERAIRVTADPEARVAPHWFGRSRLDFRPRTYWKPGTRVTLDLRLRHVRAARGVYGVQRKRVHFTVGRDQRSVVDARTHTMTVRRGGVVVNTVPVTAGSAENPTYTGRMVISQKFRVTRMNASTVGFGGEYDIEDVPHAMRLTDSGTFLHGNYWASRSTFGTANVSHGCVGLRDRKGGDDNSPAGSFYHRSLIGDLVKVKGSGERTLGADNGLGGWNMSWRAWRAGSALN
ncbi:MAG: Ig-like domain-containing protein [Streptomyces sp.]|uniref:L,D-transpeptidase n=1 Tax=Streptomyces sp. TaxID=1931 RepID=UPI003D6AC408